jgi:hypothetical protein
VDLDYFGHYKTVRLVGICGDGAAEYPIRLWTYVGKYHALDGCLKTYSPDQLETAVNWRGERGKLVDAMVEAGFLEKLENGYAVHDWEEHCGHLAAYKKRAKTAAKKRWKKHATSNAKDMRKHGNDDALTILTKRTKQTMNTSVDDQWVQTLKTDPDYAGIDIDFQLRKAKLWYKAKSKKLSRRGFMNWLVRALNDRPLHADTCECGKPGTVKVGQSWRCLEHAAKPVKERLPL